MQEGSAQEPDRTAVRASTVAQKRGNGAWSEGTQEGGGVKDRTAEPEAVPEMAKTSGDIRSRWEWVEAAVWTERMLTALEDGVEGGKWYSMMDKVVALPTLRRAFQRVKANRGAAGVDHVTVEGYEQHLEENLKKLAQRIRAGRYPTAGSTAGVDSQAGSQQQRPLGIPTVQDRVAQAATLAVMEPIFERDFAEHSYGFRPGRSCKDALRQVDRLLKQGYTWVVDADLSSYFDTIPHAGLMARVANKIADGAVLGLIEAFLQAQSHGNGSRMDSPGRNAARCGAQSAALQHLSRSAGPTDGGRGMEYGEICG